jgi:hypothetical protein
VLVAAGVLTSDDGGAGFRSRPGDRRATPHPAAPPILLLGEAAARLEGTP